MDDFRDEWVLLKDTLNDTMGTIVKDALEANDVRYQCREKIVGVRYKTKKYDIYVLREDVDKAEECLNRSEFSNIPWDPDSDDTNPEPDMPWYLDEKKRYKVSRWIMLIVFGIVFAALLIRTMY